MRQVTAEQWADHCSNFRTTGTEQNFRSGFSWLTLAISQGAPKHWQLKGEPGAIVGRVEYRPDGTRVYFIL